MQDLTWLKTLITNYKNECVKLRDQLAYSDMMRESLDSKTEAADEILEEIKKFIAEANELIKEQND